MRKKKSGGYRIGSGRPKGTGKYPEETKPIRVPVSLLPRIEALLSSTYLDSANAPDLIPLYSSRVAAGSPSAVTDDIEDHIDLNKYLIQRPSTVFLVRAKGDSMIDAGIFENDLLIVDRAIKPTAGKIVIAILNGELTVKRLAINQQRYSLLPENNHYRAIEILDNMDFSILGVVIHTIHTL